jgi:hypothetical protein
MRIATLFLCSALVLSAESVAGLKWTGPAGWKSETNPSNMRAATYSVAPAAGDTAPSECVVYYFGPGQGGTVEANIDRWKGQFTTGGKPADAKVAKRTVHGLQVTTVDATGDYSGMGGPMAKSKGWTPGYRLLGAIVEGSGNNNLFIKFTGPAKTIAANQQKFEALVNSFAKE